jgi:hypothetical protein
MAQLCASPAREMPPTFFTLNHHEMKKLLSTIALTLAVLFGKSQVILNEVYTNPGSGNHEFFELYNTSSQDVDLDCYTLVSLFKQGSKLGIYVLNLPKLTVAKKSYFVGAAAKTFNVQQNSGKVANFSWNDFTGLVTGSLQGFVQKNTTSYEDPFTPAAGFNNLFPELSPGDAGGVVYAIFLFNKDIYVNGLLTGYNNTTVPDAIKNLPPLTVSVNTSCTSFTINWQNVKAAENVNQSGGNDNGYARRVDGICGSWFKTAPGDSHTPGAPNGSLSNSSGTLLSTTEQVEDCTLSAPKITFNISSSSNATAFPVDVYLYEDYITVGNLDGNDVLKHTFNPIISGSNTFYSYNIDKNKNYLLVYETALGCLDKIVSLNCPIALPVHFKSFSAARNQQKKEQVLLKWETASEQNNRGFNVQRKVGGQWKNIAFVFSQADNGNSNAALAYEYKEINTANTVSQYQIQQVDFDGKTSYSDIKSVLGLEQKSSVLIYPNPAVDGKVKLLFSELGNVKDVIVSDMNGRMVKQFRQLADTNLTIEGLQKGFYTIKIIDRTTATTTVEKVIIR